MNKEEIIAPFFREVEGKNLFSLDFVNSYKNFAKRFKDGALLKTMLEQMKEGIFNIKDLASKSYSHENSFIKLVLWENKNSHFRLRLHYWNKVINNEFNCNIHNHRFNFASFILKGKIKNVIWVMDKDAESYCYYHYRPRLKKANYEMSRVGSVNLRVLEEKVLEEGDLYYLDYKTLHTSENVVKESISLFIEDRSSLGEYAKVFSNKYLKKDDFSISSPPLKEEEYVNLLNHISILLSDP